MHTRTLPTNTEAGGLLDRRIIVDELSIIVGRATAIMAALAVGDQND